MKNVLFLLLCLLIAGCTNGALYRADPNYVEKGWAGCVTKAVSPLEKVNFTKMLH